MKKSSLTQRHQTEKAIIDALLKISEIVQKTEASRKHQKSINTNKCSKKIVGDGDYNQLYDDNDQQQVPLPPPMRTLDSSVSGFNQQQLKNPSNCNQASNHRPKKYSSSSPLNRLENSKASKKQRLDSNDYKDQEHSYKGHYYDISSTSSSSDIQHHRKKSSRHKAFRANKNPQPMCQEIENQPAITTVNSQTTSYQINSAATTILDDQSSSLVMMPITSAPTISPPIIIEQQQKLSSPSDILTTPNIDFDLFIDQQLQATLEKCLKNHLLSSTKTTNENIQQQRKTRLSTLTKSETEKLIEELDFTKQTCNLEHYEKQRKLAMLATKQGNYSLSYMIYTNLLHDNQYDCKLKSEILSSRATTLLLEQKCFESIDDCTQAVAFNQWNKLAYVVRAACWMIKQEYMKAVEDYSKLFHFFDQSQHVLDLLNLAYEKFQLSNHNIDDDQSIKIEQENKNTNIVQQPITSSITQSLSLASPTASFIQPAVYLCYPYQAYPTCYNTHYEQKPTNEISLEERFQNLQKTKHISSNNTIRSTINPVPIIEHECSSMNKKSQSDLIWIQNPYRSF